MGFVLTWAILLRLGLSRFEPAVIAYETVRPAASNFRTIPHQSRHNEVQPIIPVMPVQPEILNQSNYRQVDPQLLSCPGKRPDDATPRERIIHIGLIIKPPTSRYAAMQIGPNGRPIAGSTPIDELISVS